MYRQKIQEYYEFLSPSYRKVADYILSHYYEVAFMTAAQLADAVGVDTTTVVRFSQRLGYHGYPGLLQDIRAQVKEEIYAVYQPAAPAPGDPAGLFKAQLEQEQSYLRQALVHNPPKQLNEAIQLLRNHKRIFLVAEGHTHAAAEVMAQQLQQQGALAVAVQADPVLCAATLVGLGKQDLVVGISASDEGQIVAQALSYAKEQGCDTLGIIGSLKNPVNRIAHQVLYVPMPTVDPFASVATLTAVLTGLARASRQEGREVAERQRQLASQAYHFLIRGRPSGVPGKVSMP